MELVSVGFVVFSAEQIFQMEEVREGRLMVDYVELHSEVMKMEQDEVNQDE